MMIFPDNNLKNLLKDRIRMDSVFKQLHIRI